ncbi:MAG: mechanosensitive ion channel family protein [Steroidobacteraceae bacterium]|nr:mechanosensitive ion channel family protein [Deltaproteobacteria bacterium]
MQNLVVWLSKATGISVGLYSLLLTYVTGITFLWSLRWLILKLVWRQTENLKVRYQWQKISGYAAFVLTALLVGRGLFEGFHGVATFLGLLTAGLAISLKDPLVNLVGWMLIFWRRPFAVGDRIQIGIHSGDVMDLTLFRFTLAEIGNWVHADQITGRIVHIPNGKVFVEPLAIYSRGMHDFIWNEVAVLVTFESNWKRAKDILNEIAVKHAGHLAEPAERKLKEYARDFLIVPIDLTPKVFTTVEENGILLTVRHLCPSRHRRESTQEIWEDVLNRFAECDDIDFAYRTTRSYNNVTEGKRGTVAKLPTYAHDPKTERTNV